MTVNSSVRSTGMTTIHACLALHCILPFRKTHTIDIVIFWYLGYEQNNCGRTQHRSTAETN